MNFYTSDLHLFSNDVLQTGRLKERPFSTLEEMHETIKNNWNKKVRDTDHVYILGDIAKRGSADLLSEYLFQLKGKLHWIIGNHDEPINFRVKKRFIETCMYKEILDFIGDKTYRLALCHYPIFSWNGQYSGIIHLYGHTHKNVDDRSYQRALSELDLEYRNQKENKYIPLQAYNVGCMHWNYEPVSLGEILGIQNLKDPTLDKRKEDYFFFAEPHRLRRPEELTNSALE